MTSGTSRGEARRRAALARAASAVNATVAPTTVPSGANGADVKASTDVASHFCTRSAAWTVPSRHTITSRPTDSGWAASTIASAMFVGPSGCGCECTRIDPVNTTGARSAEIPSTSWVTNDVSSMVSVPCGDDHAACTVGERVADPAGDGEHVVDGEVRRRTGGHVGHRHVDVGQSVADLVDEGRPSMFVHPSAPRCDAMVPPVAITAMVIAPPRHRTGRPGREPRAPWASPPVPTRGRDRRVGTPVGATVARPGCAVRGSPRPGAPTSMICSGENRWSNPARK